MSLVIDSSVALAWIHADETTAAVESVFDRVAVEGAWVPSLWRLEIANALEMAVRRGRLARDLLDSTLADLSTLPINVDADTDRHAWGPVLGFAARYGLSVYDAAYLELASRRSLPLATLDDALRHAAEQQQVVLLGK